MKPEYLAAMLESAVHEADKRTTKTEAYDTLRRDILAIANALIKGGKNDGK